MKQVKRSDLLAFLDVAQAQTLEQADYKIIGNGVTTLSYSYNPSSTTETYIIHDNATTTLDSYAFSIDGEQTALFGDDVFDFIDGLRTNLAVGSSATTNLLLIDKYNEVSEGNFKAQVFTCVVSVTSYGGDGGVSPKIGFTISANGNPKNGTATISNGVPTFSESI